jgi:hypothetical protein
MDISIFVHYGTGSRIPPLTASLATRIIRNNVIILATGDIGPWHDVWIMNADGSSQRRLTSESGQFSPGHPTDRRSW